MFTSLPTPSNEYMKQLKDRLYKFVWDGTANIRHIVFTKKKKNLSSR